MLIVRLAQDLWLINVQAVRVRKKQSKLDPAFAIQQAITSMWLGVPQLAKQDAPTATLQPMLTHATIVTMLLQPVSILQQSTALLRISMVIAMISLTPTAPVSRIARVDCTSRLAG
jgi:hypothetical protein